MEMKFSTEHDGKKRRLYKVSCFVCKSDLWKPKHRIKERIYCCWTCEKIGKNKKTETVCATCNKALSVYKKRIDAAKSGLLFCNRECKEKAQSIDGGRIEIQPTHYHSNKGRNSYRARALRRYAKKCVCCGYGEIVRMLDVHHKDGDRNNGDITNFEVLCVWCHALQTRRIKAHSWSGKLNVAIV